MNGIVDNFSMKPAEAAAPDLEQECETWAFARAAGVSAQELRSAVQRALGETPARR